jgi:hypothetical protein
MRTNVLSLEVCPKKPHRLEDQSHAVAYSLASQWFALDWQAFSSGHATLGEKSGARATLLFRGSAVRWLAATGPVMGMADVFLDSVHVGEVDLYSAKLRTRVVVLALRTDRDSVHTLEIRVRAVRNPRSQRSLIVIDALEVTE